MSARFPTLVGVAFGCAATVASWYTLAQTQPPKMIHSLGKVLVAQRCIQGYVWREAYTGDVVCVGPPRRESVRSENELAPMRVQPGGGAYGPDTCRSGFVWREARPTDHVCVTPDSRGVVARENARAPQLWSPCSTPENCQRVVQEKQARVDELRARLAQRRSELEQRRRDLEQSSGYGKKDFSDNVPPIEQDIREIEAALRDAEREAALADAERDAARMNR